MFLIFVLNIENGRGKSEISYCTLSYKFRNIPICKKHKLYDNRAYYCENISSPCQYINLIKDADALQFVFFYLKELTPLDVEKDKKIILILN